MKLDELCLSWPRHSQFVLFRLCVRARFFTYCIAGGLSLLQWLNLKASVLESRSLYLIRLWFKHFPSPYHICFTWYVSYGIIYFILFIETFVKSANKIFPDKACDYGICSWDQRSHVYNIEEDYRRIYDGCRVLVDQAASFAFCCWQVGKHVV